MKIYKIAIPVPFQSEWKEKSFESNALDYLDENIDGGTSNLIEQKYPNARPISGGEFGLAYDGGNNMVVKITSDETEYVMANKLKNNPSDLFVDVYDCYPLEKTNKGTHQIFIIELEKVKLLNENEKENYFGIWNKYTMFNSYVEKRKSHLNFDVWEGFIDVLNKFGFFDNEDNIKFFQKVENFFYKLKKEGISWNGSDVHGDNIGWNHNDELVILDLGGISDNSEIIRRPRPKPQKK